MAATKIDAQELIHVLEMTPASQNVMLIGRHGIGKSQIITRHFAKRGMIVIPFFLGQMSDPGDLIGLMHKDEATGRSIFLPPFWWPQEGEPIVLFLDELNRARPEVLQSVMDLALNKTLAGRALPEGSVVISAVNEGDEYQLTELDPALVSRFNLYEFAPTVEDWLVWAADSKIDHRVIDFIQSHPTYLDADPKLAKAEAANTTAFGGDLTKSPDRRAWEKVAAFVAPIEQLSDLHAKAIAGIIGPSAALQFVRMQRVAAPAVSADDVLFRFGKTKAAIAKLTVPELVGLNDQLLLRLQSGTKEFSAAEKKTALANFTSYLQFLQSGQQNEAIAHLANQLDHSRYTAVSEFVMASPDVLTLMTEFIEAIEVE